MIKIKNLTKKYGSVYAVRDLTFDVNKGEIIGFLGPNGAGKSTTMNILTGYIPSTSGDVLIDGYNIVEDPMEVKKRIGYLPEIPPLYLDMRVMEYLNFVADLKKVKKNDRKEQFNSIIEKLKIDDVKNRKIQNLSKGYKQRVGLAQALIGNPEVLILDEPTVGLDPRQIIEIRELIKSLAKDHTVILSSHILSEVSAVCSRVIIINKGEILAVDTPRNLACRLNDKKRLQIKVEASKKESIDIINGTDGVLKVEVLDEDDNYTTYKLECLSDVDVEKSLFFKLADKKIPIKEIMDLGNSLEEIFLEIIESNKKLVEEENEEEEKIEENEQSEEVEKLEENEQSEEVEIQEEAEQSEEVEKLEENEQSEEVEKLEENEQSEEVESQEEAEQSEEVESQEEAEQSEEVEQDEELEEKEDKDATDI